jgi:hypothetical protein
MCPVTLDVHDKPSLDPNAYVFAVGKAWAEETADGKWRLIPGEPGSWYKAVGKGFFTRCPQCSTVSWLSPNVSKVDKVGRIIPDIRCMGRIEGKRPCGFARVAYLDKAWGKTLYAIVLLHNGKPETHYMHGFSQAEARDQLIPLDGSVFIIGVAPAIGLHVLDNHGEKLIARG